MISDSYVENLSSSSDLVTDQSSFVLNLREHNAERGDLCQQTEFGTKSDQGAWQRVNSLAIFL